MARINVTRLPLPRDNFDRRQQDILIRELENILGMEKKIFTNNELGVKMVARKSLVTAKNILKGKVLKKRDLVFKRPGSGISPTNLKKVLGRAVRKNIKKNELLKIKDLI